MFIAMKVSVRKIKIFKIMNRKGYGALCLNHLTEGKTVYQVYERMLKALKRNGIKVNGKLDNIKRLIKETI